jgi:hypothetical protein
MELVRVELDGQALVVPEHVDLLCSDPGVEGRKGKIGLAAEVGEPTLEVGAGERPIAVGIQCGPQRSQAAPAMAASDERLDLAQVEQIPPLGRFQRAVEPTRGDLGDVEQGSSDGSHGNALYQCPIVVVKVPYRVHHNAPMCPACGHCDVDHGARVGKQPPKARGAHVADKCARAAGERGGHHATVTGQDCVADRIDPDVQSMQPPGSHSVLNRASAKAQRHELRMRNNAILPPRELRYLTFT